jgi:hypothetical protein
MIRIVLILAAAIAAFGASSTPAQAAASCTVTDYRIAATSSLVSSGWEASCNTAWNLQIVLQYRDAGLWHNAACAGGAVCRHQKPSNGGWFTADSLHAGTDDWGVTRPADICNHPFRQRFNFAFFSGAGGITVNGGTDTDPCHA